MHVVVRSYSGQSASGLFELLEQHQGEIKELIEGVPGFVSYVAFRSGEDTGSTVTVCESKVGTDESSRRAAEWIKGNFDAAGAPPEITEGTTFLSF